MQAVAQETSLIETPKPTFGVTIRYEWLVMMALVVFATIFHLAGLDEIPLSHSEANQALSAWRSTMPNVSGDPIVSDNPLVWWSQKIAFSLIGGSEFASRVFTALAGISVSVSPLMFIPLLGRSRAYLMTILLGISPILLATARISSGTTWALLLAVMMVWFGWRFYETALQKYGLATLITGAFLVLMTESQSILLLLTLIGAGIIALLLTSYANFVDGNETKLVAQARARIAQIPFIEGMMLSGLIIFAVASGFMFAPDGLNTIGALLAQIFAGWTAPTEGYRPFEILIFYEIWLIPFFFLAVGLLITRREMSFVERFLIGWAGLALIALIIYPDMHATHASWLVLPMSAMMAYVVSQAFFHVVPPIQQQVLVTDDRGILWGKLTVVIMTFVLLILFTSHMQFVSRGILLLQNGTPTNFFASVGSAELAREVQSRQYVGVSEAMLVAVIVLVMMLIGYFLATTIWGTLVPLQGAVIGMFIFVCMAGFGTAWGVAMHRAQTPLEMFHHPQAPSIQTMNLRKTLDELAFRAASGTTALKIASLAPSDGVVAWILRDYHQTDYVTSIQEAQSYPVVIIPQGANAPSIITDLRGDYVGQWFEISTYWAGVSGVTSYWQPLRFTADKLKYPQRSFAWEINLDLITWWLLREVRTQPQMYEALILWVRQDVYDNVPLVTQ